MAAVTPRVWADLASRLALTKVQEHNASSANSTGAFLSFTLYTMSSCSPSLRVVPSYLINLTKDRANIFSDLSLAEKQEKSHI